PRSCRGPDTLDPAEGQPGLRRHRKADRAGLRGPRAGMGRGVGQGRHPPLEGQAGPGRADREPARGRVQAGGAMTPDERDRLAKLEQKVADMEPWLKDIDHKLDQLIAAANMGKGAWWAVLKI